MENMNAVIKINNKKIKKWEKEFSDWEKEVSIINWEESDDSIKSIIEQITKIVKHLIDYEKQYETPNLETLKEIYNKADLINLTMTTEQGVSDSDRWSEVKKLAIEIKELSTQQIMKKLIIDQDLDLKFT